MDQNDRETVEDTPEYRSAIVMKSLSAPSLPRSFALPRKFEAHTKAKSSTICASWTVTDLPELPAGYILERSNVYVENESQEVSRRISNFLRLESIAATFDDEEKNLLTAETNCCLRFAVRLFADSNMVVVEVQRKSGCSFTFRKVSRAVLSAAKGIKNMAPKRRFTLPGCIQRDTREQQRKRTESGLKIAVNLLQDDREDSQMLGLESLEQLTRSPDCRVDVAKVVLSGECLCKLISLIKANRLEISSDMQERRSLLLQRRALEVLANAMGTLSETGEIGSFLDSASSLKSRCFLDALVSILKDSPSKPFVADHAARCTQYLSICEEVGEFLRESKNL